MRANARVLFITAAVFFSLLVIRYCKWRPSPRNMPGSLDWGVMRKYHPPPEIKELPTGEQHLLPSIQAPLDAFKNPYEADFRRDAVTKVFVRSWNAYKERAWMGDELLPVNGSAKDNTGYATTMVEALDSLWIMDFKDDFYRAASAAATIDFTNATVDTINIFDTNIRHLGGLLSAYDLSGEKALLEKAVELGDMLLAGFDTPNHLPTFWLNFVDADTGDQVAGEDEASAGPASMCLEFTRLSQLSGDAKYYDAADRVMRFLERIQYETKLPGMWPKTLDFKTEKAPGNRFSLGAQADVLYEYLPKMHQLLGGLDDTYEKLYKGAAKPIMDNLLFRPVLPNEDDILFAGDFIIHHRGTELVPESQHISCFAGGMFGLGGKLFGEQSHINTGERLARGCGWAFEQFPTGVMPEIFGLLPCDRNEECSWDEDRWQRQGDKSLSRGWIHARDPRYLLRPDAIESIFIMYRLTGKESWRQLAWEMFEGIIWSTETEFAHSAISDVKAKGDTEKIDSMESFWLAATLKYFYLIFSPPSLMSLDEYVFNAEAHPFRLPKIGVMEHGQGPVV